MDRYNDSQTHNLIDPDELRRLSVGTERHLVNRKRNNSDARYHQAVKTKERLEETARRCRCGVLVVRALTARNRKEILVDAELSAEGDRFTLEAKDYGFDRVPFVATKVDRFDDKAGVYGHRFHRCEP